MDTLHGKYAFWGISTNKSPQELTFHPENTQNTISIDF